MERVASIGLAYVIGSIPIGLVIVRLASGRNVLHEHSGRTGGTNVMRTAGFWAGLATAIGDLLKGFGAAWVARLLAPDFPWAHALAGIAAVLGHNHSIFLVERTPAGLRLRGGAGGATAVGAGVGLWAPVVWVIALVPFLLFGVGYASVTTLSVGGLMTIVLAVAARAGAVPWPYVAYGVGAVVLMLLALRPNLARLRRGDERRVRWPFSRRQAPNPETDAGRAKPPRRSVVPTQDVNAEG